MRKYNCSVIMAGPATGKTFLAEHDPQFVDIDGERAKYKYNLYSKSTEEIEKGKSNRGKVIRNDTKEYSIQLLEETIQSGRIALVSYQEEMLEYLLSHHIDYCLVYADISAREEYKKRMIQRGNPKAFVEQMTEEEAWNQFFEKDKEDNRPKYKILLKENQYLSDIKNDFIE